MTSSSSSALEVVCSLLQREKVRSDWSPLVHEVVDGLLHLRMACFAFLRALPAPHGQLLDLPLVRPGMYIYAARRDAARGRRHHERVLRRDLRLQRAAAKRRRRALVRGEAQPLCPEAWHILQPLCPCRVDSSRRSHVPCACFEPSDERIALFAIERRLIILSASQRSEDVYLCCAVANSSGSSSLIRMGGSLSR